MIRAVLDTNLFVSALIKPTGTVGRLIRYLRDGDFQYLYSDAVVEELVDVLLRPALRETYGLTDDDVATVLALVLLRGEHIDPAEPIRVCRDPRDDKFLALAASGHADVLVTGDRDLLTLDPFQNVRIVAPADFLHLLQGSPAPS